jgi:hypothetical protein
MPRRKTYVTGFVLPLFLFISCLHSKTTSSSSAIVAGIKISYGNAIVKIDGKINENLYYGNVDILNAQIQDEKYYDNPAVMGGTITRNETKHLATGEEYKFSVLPTEVVTMNIVSSNGDDVEIMVYQHGREEKYTVKGTDKLGLFIAVQNR